LKENGYTIVENVLSIDECNTGREHFFKWIEGFGINEATRHNLTESKFRDSTIANKHGIVEYPPSGISEPAVYGRTRPGVSKTFAQLYGCNPEDLITSLDRIQIGIGSGKDQPSPTADADAEPKTYKKGKGRGTRLVPSWAHTDQDSRSRGLQCIQGSVTFGDISDNGGSLFVLEKSHLYHDKLFQKMDALNKNIKDEKKKLVHNKKNWVKLPSELDNWMINECGCTPRVIRPVKAGSMLLWDSRLIHANVPPTDTSIRLVTYICMLPRKWVESAPRNQIIRKREAFLGARTTSHWPSMLIVFSDGAPFRNQHFDKEKCAKYAKKYTDPEERLKTIVKFLENEFSEDPTRYREIVRHVGFSDLADYKKAVAKYL